MPRSIDALLLCILVRLPSLLAQCSVDSGFGVIGNETLNRPLNGILNATLNGALVGFVLLFEGSDHYSEYDFTVRAIVCEFRLLL